MENNLVVFTILTYGTELRKLGNNRRFQRAKFAGEYFDQEVLAEGEELGSNLLHAVEPTACSCSRSAWDRSTHHGGSETRYEDNIRISLSVSEAAAGLIKSAELPLRVPDRKPASWRATYSADNPATRGTPFMPCNSAP